LLPQNPHGAIADRAQAHQNNGKAPERKWIHKPKWIDRMIGQQRQHNQGGDGKHHTVPHVLLGKNLSNKPMQRYAAGHHQNHDDTGGKSESGFGLRQHAQKDGNDQCNFGRYAAFTVCAHPKTKQSDRNCEPPCKPQNDGGADLRGESSQKGNQRKGAQAICWARCRIVFMTFSLDANEQANRQSSEQPPFWTALNDERQITHGRRQGTIACLNMCLAIAFAVLVQDQGEFAHPSRMRPVIARTSVSLFSKKGSSHDQNHFGVTDGLSSDRTVLDAAIAVARIEGSHLECLHPRIDPVETAALVGVTISRRHGSIADLAQNISQEQEARSKHSQTAFQEACIRHSLIVGDRPEKTEGVSAHLEEITTPNDETLRQARFYDLVVMARDSELSSDRIHDVLMQAGRPLLIAPAKPVDAIGQTVAIVWKEGPDAARAVLAATSILIQAKRVIIISVSEHAARADADRQSAEILAKQLRWHGVHAEVRLEPASVASASQTIQGMAYGFDADLLVMGAFGHSRLRELVFGGVTRDILGACEIPVFMFH
jgi:nucleotide-binding universal stress UspA family protein